MTNARSTDVETSHLSAGDNAARASQRLLLLSAIVRSDSGLIAEEAAREVGLLHTGYWKRISDLLAEGLIRRVYDDAGRLVTRHSSAERPASVYIATYAGRVLHFVADRRS